MAVCDNRIHFVVKGSGSNNLYYGNVNLATGAFSGWTLISGQTPSKPALTAKDPTPLVADANCALFLLVRGMTNGIYLRTRTSSWGSWITLPGSTDAGPAIAYVSASDTLHMLVKGNGNNNIYWATRTVAGGTFSGWSLISGQTPSGPALTEWQPGTNRVLAVVRGTDNKIWTRQWLSASGWGAWSSLSSGSTDSQPSVIRLAGVSQFIIAVRGLDGKIYFKIGTQLATLVWGPWRALPSGTTPSSPTVTAA